MAKSGGWGSLGQMLRNSRYGDEATRRMIEANPKPEERDLSLLTNLFPEPSAKPDQVTAAADRVREAHEREAAEREPVDPPAPPKDNVKERLDAMREELAKDAERLEAIEEKP